MMKRILALLLALVMVFALCACGDGGTATSNPPASEAPATEQPGGDEDPLAAEAITPPDQATYDAESETVYNDALGPFYEEYLKAMEADSVSERYALMAISEAKLLESGALLPTATQGGAYGMTRRVPRTWPSVLFGLMANRYDTALITTDPIKAADYNEMKAEWATQLGSGTYYEWVKGYLADKGYTLKDTYTFAYSTDPQTWDDLASSLAVDHEALVNTLDFLYMYNSDNELVPGLAEKYTVSDDGLKYTFTLREGLNWVDQQGRVYAPVTADDFVAGMQHILDAMGGTEYLLGAGYAGIVGADDYMNDVTTDFTQVGVKALDDRTVEYTLTDPISFFETMLQYNIFAPMNRAYYESMGGKFGHDAYDASAADYNYGKGPDSILYCGPYLVTNATEKNTIVFQKNPEYWNADGVNLQTITWIYNDGTDATRNYNDFWAGTVDSTGLSDATITLAQQDGHFDEYAYISDNDATTFFGFMNMNRYAYANYNNAEAGVSETTVSQAERYNAAMQNTHFRRAVAFAIDRRSWNAQDVGETLAEFSLRNCYTPGNYVTLAKDVTVDINGTATTFTAGTQYGEIIQAQMDADNVPIKVWDTETASSDSFDGWFSVENAQAELEQAVSELSADGVEITADNPIYLDLPVYSGSQIRTNQANVVKQCLEGNLNGLVKVRLVEYADPDSYQDATYYPRTGYEQNYSLNLNTGWTPDFGDPQTYLGTVLPDYAGYMTKAMGVY